MNAKYDTIPQGFRCCPGFAYLCINEKGVVFNRKSRKYSTADDKNQFKLNGKMISVPKLLLLAYAKQPYQGRKIIFYLDGNSKNLSLVNLSYGRPCESRIDPDRLRTAIRCYFYVPKRYTIKNLLLTRMYLLEIVVMRGFLDDHKGKPGIDMFATYISALHRTKRDIGKEYGKSIYKTQTIINYWLNTLATEILEELAAGRRTLLDYIPRKKSTVQQLKDFDRHCVEITQKITNESI